MTPSVQLSVFIALTSLAAPLPAQVSEPVEPKPVAQQIRTFLETYSTHVPFSGTALVADHGRIVYQGAFGLANQDWNVANRIDTKFRIGSLTKQFTAMLVLLLVEDGALELEAPITRYLPNYPAASGSKVTVHHLLNHTSGIPNYDYTEPPGFLRQEFLGPLPVDEFVAEFCSGQLQFEPGTNYRYTNAGYYLLGAIVEAATGQPYGAALRERILDPLDMHDTGHADQYSVLNSRATGYVEVYGKRRVAPWTTNLFAADGLHSTVTDLWKWDQALRSKHLLSGKLEKLMFTPGPSGYGYGWHIDNHGIWHGGDLFGFSAMIGRLPAKGRCVILLSNTGHSWGKRLIPEAARGIASILRDGATRDGAHQQSAPDSSTAPDPALTSRIGDFLQAHHDHRQFDGVALVADGGKIVYQGAFGLANEDWKIPNRMNTKFRVGSITMQFTAMLALLLAKDGSLDLHAPIARYLPDYPAASARKVTVHHLLNHTSGIPCYRERSGWRAKLSQFQPVADFVAESCSAPLRSEPGSEYQFSYGGYYLLGAIIEAVTGQTYGVALHERVLEPLNLTDTGYDDPLTTLQNRATGYEEVLGQRRKARWIEPSSFFASGGLYSTVGDLWKWDQALRAQSLLSGELEERMFSPGLGDYGYGWHIDQHGTWHGGAMPGFWPMIGRIPSQGRCVILLSNSRFSSVPEAVQGIAEILAGNEPVLPSTRPERDLAQTILDRGIEAGLKMYAGLPQLVRDREVEATMHVLGYRLLKQRRAAEAAQLFEFSTKVAPRTFKRWDSLAEAQLQAGHPQLAIQTYRKALELHPGNAKATSMLEQLEAK